MEKNKSTGIKIRKVDINKKPEDRIGFNCDICGDYIDDELVLNEKIWTYIHKKAENLPYLPHETLLCPRCIERLLGRRVEVYEFVIRGAIYPINYWYLKKNKLLEKSEQYILNHARRFKNWNGPRLWIESIEKNRSRFEDLYEETIEQKLKEL